MIIIYFIAFYSSIICKKLILVKCFCQIDDYYLFLFFYSFIIWKKLILV